MQTVVVFGENLRNHRFVRHAVSRLNVWIVGIFLRGKQTGLRHRDTTQNKTGRILLGIESHFLDNALNQRFGIVGVINGDIVAKTDLFGLRTQNPIENGVEGTHRDGFGQLTTHQLNDTLPHLCSSLIGECERQNTVGTDIFHRQHISNSIGEHPCFARARTRQNHHWTIRLGDSYLLLLIEFR